MSRSTSTKHPYTVRFQTRIFLLFSDLFSALGMPAAASFGKYLGRFFYYVIPIRRGNILRGLRRAFPELPDSAIKKIARKNYENFGITLLEMLAYPAFNKEPQKWISIGDMENVGAILSRGTGVIFLTAHFGSWEFASAGFAYYFKESGFQAMAKEQKNRLISDWFDEQRGTHGLGLIHTGLSVKEAYKALQNNKPIIIAGDQRGPKEGLHVKMFGIDTPFQVGAATLSSKLGVPIIFFLAVRQKNEKYVIITEEIETSDLEKGNPENIKTLNQRYASKLEHYLRIYPEQWLWMHEIWKNVPPSGDNGTS